MKVDRKAFSVGSVLEPSDEKACWLSKTPYERLRVAELMRQIVYGYDPSTTRLQRVLEVAQRVQDTLDAVPVNLIGLEHLKRNKRASARHQDPADLEHLP